MANSRHNIDPKDVSLALEWNDIVRQISYYPIDDLVIRLFVDNRETYRYLVNRYDLYKEAFEILNNKVNNMAEEALIDGDNREKTES